MASESHLARGLRYHFSGVAGAGMNPLAQLMRARGHTVQGSDRSFEQRKNGDLEARLLGLGIELKPQDGSAVTPAIDRFVYTTAVEADTPSTRTDVPATPERPSALCQENRVPGR